MTPVAMELLNPPSADPPIGQYSQLSLVPPGSTTVNVAGQLPLNSAGNPVAQDFEAQAEHVFAALATLLEAAGTSMRRLTFLRTYLVRADDYAAFRDVRREVFARHGVTDPPPATTIVVAGLVGGSLIEVDASAVRGP